MQRTLDIVFNPITDDLYNESKAIKRTLGEVSDQAKATAKSIDQLDESIDSAAASTKKMGSAGSGVSNALKDTENQAKKLADKYKDLGDKAGDVGARTGQLKGALGALGPGAEGAANAVMDVADAGEAALKSFAALGPVAIVIGGLIAAAGVAYMAYTREQDQAKESTEQMKQAFLALDGAQRTTALSLIDLREAQGEITASQAEQLRIQQNLVTKTEDAARANSEENEEKIKQIASNKAYAETVRDIGGQVGIAIDMFAGWSDEAEHLEGMLAKDAEAQKALAAELEKQAEIEADIEAAREEERKKREKEAKAREAQAKAERKAAKEKAEADKAEAEKQREINQEEAKNLKLIQDRYKLLQDIEATTEALTASVEGFYEPAIEGEDQYAKAIRETQAEYDKLREKIHEQIAVNLEAGESVEELYALEIQLAQEKADKVSAINKEQADEKAKLDQEAAEKERSIAERIAKKIVNIRKKQGKEVSETAEEEKASQLEAAGEVLEAVVAGISEIGQAMQGYLSETTDALNEIDELQAELSDKEIDASQLKGEALVEAYKNGEIAAEDLSESQKQFIGTVLKADEEALKKKEKRQRAAAMAGFVTDKAAAISAVVINTAEAVTKALAKLGPIAGGVAAGALVTIAGAQTALIAAEKPSFASGVANYRPDAVDATLHTGESVLNTRATRMLGEDQVNQLNQGRSMGGEVNITAAVYQDGRLFDAQSVKSRKRFGTTMNKASRKNRLGLSSKRNG